MTVQRIHIRLGRIVSIRCRDYAHQVIMTLGRECRELSNSDAELVALPLIHENNTEEDADQTVLCIGEAGPAGIFHPELRRKSLQSRVATIDPLPQVRGSK